MIRMTDMQNSFLPKKSEMESYKAQDLKKQNESEKSEETSLVPSIKKETLTIVKGVGQKVAEKLRSIEIHTISDLAHSSPERVARAPGIGLSTAQKFVSSASEYVRMKKLNDFSEPQEPVNFVPSSPTIEMIQEEEVSDSTQSNISEYDDPYFGYVDDDLQDEMEEEIEEEDNSESDVIIEPPPEPQTFEEESNFQEVKENDSISIPPRSPPSVVVPPEAVRQSYIAEQERSITTHETLSSSEITDAIHYISKQLNLSEFTLIERTSELRSAFTGIDLLAIKHVRVKEFLDLIYIILIKMSTLKGSFIVSGDDIQYTSITNSKDSSLRLKSYAQSSLKALMKVRDAIQSNLLTEGSMLRYLSRYITTPISLEKTITKKHLFFRSGPLQYKILIEPILVCNNTVGFTEKVIPFAYHKTTNLHIVEHSQFSDLLQYLDQKYFFIETYSEQKNAVLLDCEAANSFLKDVRKYSFPFMAFGIVLLFILLSQAYFLLSIFINLGYGVVAMYIIMGSYLYLKLHKERSALSEEFATPYYRKNLAFDDGTLMLIKEELSSKMMDQFVYECIGKNSKYTFLDKLETENTQKIIEERVQNKKIEQSNIFEQEIGMPFDFNSDGSEHTPSQKKSEEPAIKDKYVDKYGSFLEE
jgi:hypothetical protein